MGLVSSLRHGGLLRIPRPDDYTLLDLIQIVLPANLSKTRNIVRISLGTKRVAEMLHSLPSKVGEPLLPWLDCKGRRMGLTHFTNTMANFQRAAGIADCDRVKAIAAAMLTVRHSRGKMHERKSTVIRSGAFRFGLVGGG